jgi:hypothetical protein
LKNNKIVLLINRMASNNRYLPPVHGHPGPIEAEKAREDPELLTAAMANAVDYVERQDPQAWLDCFAMNDKVYDVNICPCNHPSIICRAMGEENPHKLASSRKTNEMADDFIQDMGARIVRIMNALRKHREDREAPQRVTPEAAEPGAQAERRPPSSSGKFSN